MSVGATTTTSSTTTTTTTTTTSTTTTSTTTTTTTETLAETTSVAVEINVGNIQDSQNSSESESVQTVAPEITTVVLEVGNIDESQSMETTVAYVVASEARVTNLIC